MEQRIRQVDPAELRLPPSRSAGADLWKLHRQIREYSTSTVDMPPLLVYEGPDGALEIFDRVTRATRIAKSSPGTTVPVIVIGKYRNRRRNTRRLGDTS
jgi:hypothetical protein